MSIYEYSAALVQTCVHSFEWQMLFNRDKSNVLHLGHNNPQAEYEIGWEERLLI